MSTIVQLRSRVANAERFAGTIPDATHVDLLLQGDVDVYRPDGQPLCLLRRGWLSAPLLEAAYPALHSLRTARTSNRGKYAGEQRIEKVFTDGKKSKNTHTTPVASAVVGYFDRQGGRFPYCRTTAFTANETAAWQTVLPLADRVAVLMQDLSPARYAKQLDHARRCHPDFIIRNSPFSTLTVNNNVALSGIHRDAGDFKDGIGAISVLRRGHYTGAWLVFPEYRVGVDLGHGDVLLFNSHDWHGVTRIALESAEAERISVVYYLREKMLACGSAASEIARARSKQVIP